MKNKITVIGLIMASSFLLQTSAFAQQVIKMSYPFQNPLYDSTLPQLLLESGPSQTGDIQDWDTPESETLATGNGVLTTFTPTFSNTPIAQNSIVIRVAGVQTPIIDDGHGVLFGLGLTSGTINYSTGSASLTFRTAPANLAAITATYAKVGAWVDSSAVFHSGGLVSGTVTSVATTGPITGGTITTTGTIACATCAIGPGTSTANHLAKFSGTDGITLADGGAIPTGTVTSVSGTTNQIASTGGATPVLSLTSPLTAPGAATITGHLTASAGIASGVSTNTDLAGVMIASGSTATYTFTGTYTTAPVCVVQDDTTIASLLTKTVSTTTLTATTTGATDAVSYICVGLN